MLLPVCGVGFIGFAFCRFVFCGGLWVVCIMRFCVGVGLFWRLFDVGLGCRLAWVFLGWVSWVLCYSLNWLVCRFAFDLAKFFVCRLGLCYMLRFSFWFCLCCLWVGWFVLSVGLVT